MRHAVTAAIFLTACFAGPARAREPFPTVVMPGQDVRSNSPGLECRQTSGHVPAYDAPSQDARVVRYMPSVVAVTGPAKGGFVPIVTGDGRSAWVRVSDMLPVSRHKTCFVQRTREGNLRWTKSNAIQ